MAKKKKKAEEKKSRTKWILLIIAVIVTGTIFMYMYGDPAPRYIPQELIGVWRTTDSAYADRFIEFSSATISFGTGADTISQTGFMKEVERTSEGGKTLYIFKYEQDGAPAQLSFFYEGPDSEGLRLKNKSAVLWVKQKDAF